jgi:hypothetical protein
MKTSSIRDWLIDSVVIAGLTVVAIFFLPLLSACFGLISLYLGRTLFWVHFTVLDEFLPHIIVGALLGSVTAWLVRHRSLSLAVLPSVLFSLFYFLNSVFGAEPYSWGRVFWLDSIFAGDWLIMVIASIICAGFVLRRRQPVTVLEPLPD